MSLTNDPICLRRTFVSFKGEKECVIARVFPHFTCVCFLYNCHLFLHVLVSVHARHFSLSSPLFSLCLSIAHKIYGTSQDMSMDELSAYRRTTLHVLHLSRKELR